MAIPSRGIGWSTEDNLLWQISKQLEQLTNVTAKGCTTTTSTSSSTTTTTTTLPVYQVYTALLTQTGGDNPNLVADLPLLPGTTYKIIDNDGGTADFTNVGAPNNTVGTYFVATGTTPTSWGDNLLGQLEYNAGAPTVIVLENTIGNIWFTYNAIGQYPCESDNLFITDKTTIDIDAYGQNGNPAALISTSTIFPTNKFSIFTYKSFPDDDILTNNRIEIRVYN